MQDDPSRTGRRGLFLDRDGVVNVDTHFAHRPADIVFMDGIFDLVARARAAGFVPVIVTNQSGIARGLFPEAAYLELTAWMLGRFEAAGAPVERVYHCPFLPDATVPAYRHPDHPWRKPRPGMLFQARDDLGLDLSASALIGDRWSDIGAARAAGVPRAALVGTGPMREAGPPDLWAPRLPDLAGAADWLLSGEAAPEGGCDGLVRPAPRPSDPR